MARAMARRRPPRKSWFVKGEYYPKVDLSDLDDRLPSSWSPSSVVTPAEQTADESPAVAAESAREEEEVMPPPVAIIEAPVVAAAPAAAPAAAKPANAAEVFRLPASLDLPAARPLAAAFVERRGRPLAVDATAVAQLGAQCVQVLLSARRSWDADGQPLSIVNVSARMDEDLKLIGIDRKMFATGVLPQ